MTPDPPAGFRTGLVALVGRTNVGKSTLLNGLVDAKLSIVSPRPQTTRHAIHGAVHRPGGQVIFVDTPGFFHTHRSRLVDRLHARARAALEGIDAVVHVVDPSRPLGVEDDMVTAALRTRVQPRVLCLNKSDLRKRPYRDDWLMRSDAYAAVLEVSAIARRGLDSLVDSLLELLPAGPPLYPRDEVTNVHQDFRITEIIREKIYRLTREEIPYRTAVRLDSLQVPSEAGSRVVVRATILVAQARYKAMLIGAAGRMVREIGAAARSDLEHLLRNRVLLELTVRVDTAFPE